MKVSPVVASQYFDIKDELKALQEECEVIIRSFSDCKWFVTSRIKSPESVALKLETCRYNAIEGIGSLDDLVGFTIVVEDASKVGEAESRLLKRFEVTERRPVEATLTHNKPQSFSFDDLRLYCNIKRSSGQQPKTWDKYSVEIQIKTFLQHAWGIATHDLIYKGDQVSWARARVAHQVKASLELAECSIAGISGIAEHAILNKEDDATKTRREVVEFLKDKWSPEDLPEDVIRCADNIISLLRILREGVDKLKELFDQDPTLKLSLSPYGNVLEKMLNAGLFNRGHMGFLKSKNRIIYIPSEIDCSSYNLDKSVFVSLKENS